MSRIESPTRLKPKTVNSITIPGKKNRWGATKMYCLDPLIIVPHSGSGGCIPNPTKPKAARDKIDPAVCKLAKTIIGEIIFGKMWRNNIRESLLPIMFAALM